MYSDCDEHTSVGTKFLTDSMACQVIEELKLLKAYLKKNFQTKNGKVRWDQSGNSIGIFDRHQQ